MLYFDKSPDEKRLSFSKEFYKKVYFSNSIISFYKKLSL